MFRLLKIMLIWLVMIALPTQGIAAAVMLDCGEGHRHVVSGITPTHDHATHRHADQVVDNTDAGDHPAAKNSTKFDLQGKCSACAGCCLSTIAFTSINAPLILAGAGLTTTRAPEKRFAVNFPDGLERPPHSLPL
jgi:hypothetical protein